MIAAGRMDRRITIEVMGPPVDDGMRATDGAWGKLADRWAELAPLSGAERVAAAENAAVQTLRFRVRRDSVTVTVNPATHRIVYRGQPFDLQMVTEIGRQAFDLTVTGRADGAAVE